MTNAPLSPQVFWEQTEAELAELNPDVSLERDSFYSQPEWDVYRMGYTSTGGHRLSAWISVPKSAPAGGGPRPRAGADARLRQRPRHHLHARAPSCRGDECHLPGPAQQR